MDVSMLNEQTSERCIVNLLLDFSLKRKITRSRNSNAKSGFVKTTCITAITLISSTEISEQPRQEIFSFVLS